ncbi:MAG: hypothetical protein ACRDQ5_02540 [Sciscionella sp.]
MDHRDLHQAVLERTGGRPASEWAASVLDDVAAGRKDVNAMRHPLGFVCIPVERDGGRGVCVHVWSDDLPVSVPTTSAMHAHSWDLVSYVLYGSLCNELIEVTDAPDDPTHRVFEVRSGGDVDEVLETGRLVRCGVMAAEMNRRGDTYSLPAGVFHATVVRGEAATVALGSSRRQSRDLSLGRIGTRTHRVQRQRCDREETARAALAVSERLASLHC